MEEEQKRIEEAKNCKDCLGWHKYCNSECCKSILINVSLERLYKAQKYLLIKVGELSPSDQRYYSLRGVRYSRGTLRFLKEKIKIKDKKIIYTEVCSMLDGNLCKIHESGKPQLCKDLTLETCNQTDRFLMTENCLFKYKCKGGTNHGKNKKECSKD